MRLNNASVLDYVVNVYRKQMILSFSNIIFNRHDRNQGLGAISKGEYCEEIIVSEVILVSIRDLMVQIESRIHP